MLELDPLWGDLLVALVSAVLGWLTRHFQQQRPTRAKFWPNDRRRGYR